MTLARALYATPLRTNLGGHLVSGLCSGWTASDGFRAWRFHCRDALAIAAQLRRVARLRASPAHWIFAAARRIAVPAPDVLVVRLRFAWQRFPYALTTVAAAPRGVPGPFRLVRGAPDRVVLRGGGQTLVFRRLTAFAALRAFRRGKLDEAPVPLGDLGAARRDPALRRVLHVRPLLAQDLVVFHAGVVPAQIRRAYWLTADRTDYQALVPENSASAALGIAGAVTKADPAAFRRGLASIKSLPTVRVRIGVPDDPMLRYGARILYAQWREVGLGPQLVRAGAGRDADFLRDLAVYPQDEALLGPLGLPFGAGAVDQRATFDRIDAGIRASATVIPICWVVDARLVSPRLGGWRQDVLGDVDYARAFLR